MSCCSNVSATSKRKPNLFQNMANTKSALKRIRQTATRTARNRATSSKLKTLRKKIATAVETADKEAAAAAYSTFSSAVDKAAKVGTIPANRASNYKSKAAKAISKIA